jgi:hypothetical protein
VIFYSQRQKPSARTLWNLPTVEWMETGPSNIKFGQRICSTPCTRTRRSVPKLPLGTTVGSSLLQQDCLSISWWFEARGLWFGKQASTVLETWYLHGVIRRNGDAPLLNSDRHGRMLVSGWKQSAGRYPCQGQLSVVLCLACNLDIFTWKRRMGSRLRQPRANSNRVLF